MKKSRGQKKNRNQKVLKGDGRENSKLGAKENVVPLLERD